jgi:hypothetical protein
MSQTKAPSAATQAEIRLNWGDMANLPITFADALHWRAAAEVCYLTVGQINLPPTEGPVVVGPDISIEPVARLAITPGTLVIWRDLLNAAIAEYEKMKATS